MIERQTAGLTPDPGSQTHDLAEPLTDPTRSS
jgi:hypothetical protein